MAPDTIPPAMADGIQKLIDAHMLERGERKQRSLGTFWPIMLCLVGLIGVAFLTSERAAKAEFAIEDPTTGLRAKMNGLELKVDRIGTILEERLPKKAAMGD